MQQSGGGESTVNQDQVYESLKASKFKQQRLPAWRPVPTITSTTITFVSFGVIFITLGAVILAYSKKIIEISERYDNICTMTTPPTVCTKKITIPQQMQKPIMVYYQLNNFYQNHRRYVKSKSDSQLNGLDMTLAEMKTSGDCSPVETNAQMDQLKNVNGDPLDQEAVAVPCGLIAKSFFNDTFKLEQMNGDDIPIDSTNIAWKADKDLKYKNIEKKDNPDYWKTVQWIDMTDEHFIVWMRPAGLPNFRKLWGRIQVDLEPGDYNFQIDNKFDVSTYAGEKFIILSTVNAFGGNNNFLGISYIVVGGICILLAVIFVIGYQIHQKKEK